MLQQIAGDPNRKKMLNEVLKAGANRGGQCYSKSATYVRELYSAEIPEGLSDTQQTYLKKRAHVNTTPRGH